MVINLQCYCLSQYLKTYFAKAHRLVVQILLRICVLPMFVFVLEKSQEIAITWSNFCSVNKVNFLEFLGQSKLA